MRPPTPEELRVTVKRLLHRTDREGKKALGGGNQSEIQKKNRKNLEKEGLRGTRFEHQRCRDARLKKKGGERTRAASVTLLQKFTTEVSSMGRYRQRFELVIAGRRKGGVTLRLGPRQGRNVWGKVLWEGHSEGQISESEKR